MIFQLTAALNFIALKSTYTEAHTEDATLSMHHSPVLSCSDLLKRISKTLLSSQNNLNAESVDKGLPTDRLSIAGDEQVSSQPKNMPHEEVAMPKGRVARWTLVIAKWAHNLLKSSSNKSVYLIQVEINDDKDPGKRESIMSFFNNPIVQSSEVNLSDNTSKSARGILCTEDCPSTIQENNSDFSRLFDDLWSADSSSKHKDDGLEKDTYNGFIGDKHTADGCVIEPLTPSKRCEIDSKSDDLLNMSFEESEKLNIF